MKILDISNNDITDKAMDWVDQGLGELTLVKPKKKYNPQTKTFMSSGTEYWLYREYTDVDIAEKAKFNAGQKSTLVIADLAIAIAELASKIESGE